MGNLCTRPSRSTSGSINIKQNPKLATREDTHTSQDGNQVVVSNTHQAVLGADLDSIRVQYSNSTASTSSTSAQPTKPTLVLLPHQHTLFCERKQRVCTAVGKCQEMENLKFAGIENHTSEWIWIRASSSSVKKDFKDYSNITATDCKTQYTLCKEDVGFYIIVRYIDSTTTEVKFSNAIGPIVPGPPRLLDFIITGDSKVGGHAKAEAKYIGGFEGPSEYWWIRVTKDGKRQQITDPKPIGNAKQDPRLYKITADDVGCTLKAKCKPIRCDGAPGEIFTSKSSVTLS